MAFLNIKKKNSKKNNNQYIKSVDSYNGNNETFVYNSYPNNQMPNQMPMNYPNNQMPNQAPMNYQNNMNYNQPMPNQAVNNQQVNMPYNQVIPNQNMNNNVIRPKMNRQDSTNETLDVLEPAEVLTESLDELQVEDELPELDPLNNANNPIPVNPVAPAVMKEELTEEEKNAKANFLAVIGMIIGMIFKPGTTVIDSIKKYRDFYKGSVITFWITVITLLGTLVVRILAGSFYRSYNSITGSYSVNFNFNNILSLQNYVPYLIVALIVSLAAILVVTLVYYASSFFNSKGVRFGSYLAVSNVAMIPMIIGIVVLNPILSILSDYLGIIGIIVPFLYSLMSFTIGIDYILEFKNSNSKIYYNVLNLSIILFIMVLIVMGLFNLNLISLPSLFT